MGFEYPDNWKLNTSGVVIQKYFKLPKPKIIAVTIIFLLIITFVNTLSYQIWNVTNAIETSDCLGLCYRGFKVKNITSVIPDGEATIVDAMDNLSRIQCQFHAVQLAIFTSQSPSKLLYGMYKIPGTIILQMRHDGLIALPGGGVRIGESLIDALYREIKEELGMSLGIYKDTVQYLISYADHKRKYCGHLFGLQVSWDKIRSIIAQAMQIPDLGLENLGYFLMPSISEVNDGAGLDGLPNFISQSIAPHSPPKMVGNTLQQLIYILTSASNPPIFSKPTLDNMIKLAKQLLTITSQRHGDRNWFTGGTHLDHFYE